MQAMFCLVCLLEVMIEEARLNASQKLDERLAVLHDVPTGD